MNQLKLVFCGHIRQRIELPRPIWRFAAPKVVELEVVDDAGYTMRFELPVNRCLGLKGGDYVRVKHRVAARAFSDSDAGWFAFRAPTPKPGVVGRGRVVRAEHGLVHVSLADGGETAFERCNVRGEVRMGDATRVVAHRHGNLEQYFSRYLEVLAGRVTTS